MSRYKSRESAFLLLFEGSFKPDEPAGELIANFYEQNDPLALGDETAYFEKLVKDVSDKGTQIDTVIDELAVGWKANRISRIARTILRIAIVELNEFPDIPTAVSINEAVELAKKYDTKQTASFINGILATYVKNREPQES